MSEMVGHQWTDREWRLITLLQSEWNLNHLNPVRNLIIDTSKCVAAISLFNILSLMAYLAN